MLVCGFWNCNDSSVAEEIWKQNMCDSCTRKKCLWAGMTSKERETLYKQKESMENKGVEMSRWRKWQMISVIQTDVGISTSFHSKNRFKQRSRHQEVWCNILSMMQQIDLDLRWTQMGSETATKGIIREMDIILVLCDYHLWHRW